MRETAMRAMRIRKPRGFSLIDLMIGLAIGLIGVLAVTKVLLTFTQQRNTITETAEAQGNGAMALYLIERDVAQAGYGMMNLSNCAQIHWYKSSDPACTSCASVLPVQAIVIGDGGTESDSVRVQYGLTASGATATTISLNQASSTAPYNVASTVGFDNTTDLIVANVAGSCTMSQVTGVNAGSLQVLHANTSPFNPAAAPPADATSGGWESAKNGDVLVNLGGFVSKIYSISSNKLQVSAFPSFPDPTIDPTAGLVDGIVFMKAQYGLDTNSDGIVDTWGDGTTIVSNMNQVLAVRIGIVAQSPVYEKDGIDAPTTLTVLPAMTALPAPGWAAIPAVTYTIPDLDANLKAHYRYRTYSTTIPLRNMIWGR